MTSAPIESLAGPAIISLLTFVAGASNSASPDVDGLIGGFLKEGGLVAILAVLIYFYRRDWVRLNESNRDQNAQLLEVIRESNQVHRDTSLAIQRNSDAIGTLSDAIDRQAP